MDAKSERAERLAEALRANLRRRKAQAGALDDDAPAETALADEPDEPVPQ
jgi:hypothetical protein